MRAWRSVPVSIGAQVPRAEKPRPSVRAVGALRMLNALTPKVSARNQMTLYREVHPLLMSQTHQDRDVLLWEAEQVLLEQGVVDYGDLIVLTIGEPIGSSGGTNTLKIVRVGEHHRPGTLDDPV